MDESGRGERGGGVGRCKRFVGCWDDSFLYCNDVHQRRAAGEIAQSQIEARVTVNLRLTSTFT